MNKSNSYWTSPKKDGGWAVKREGNSQATSIHNTQAEAWAEAKARAKVGSGEAYLKGKDNRIRERNTYGSDPFPPKG
jgi:hypothetical protein